MVRTTYLWRRIGEVLATIAGIWLFSFIIKDNEALRFIVRAGSIVIGLYYLYWSKIVVDAEAGLLTIPTWAGKTDLNLAELENYDIDSLTKTEWNKGQQQYETKTTNTLTLYGTFGSKRINCGGGKAAHQAINDIKQAKGITG